MTRFEEIGVDIQYSSYNKKQAERSFVKSCEMCCTKGIRIDCEKCAIACAHKAVIEAFDSKVKSSMIAKVFEVCGMVAQSVEQPGIAGVPPVQVRPILL